MQLARPVRAVVLGASLATAAAVVPFAATAAHAADAPTVTSVDPTAGPTAGGNTVTIDGTDLTSGTDVFFGTVAATGVAVVGTDGTELTATAPAGAAGAVAVNVSNDDGASSTAVSTADSYTYTAAPTVTSVSPTAGPTAGDTSVTITGTNFTGATAVDFGTAAATSFTVNSATSITATDPAEVAGPVNVSVTTAGGQSAPSTGDEFTYTAAPTITSVAPTSGTQAGGTSVTITGTNLAGATAVTFGGTAATVTADSATSITATTPSSTSTDAVDVSVTTPGGTVTDDDGYTYTSDVPTVTKVSPASGYTSGGETVTITGTNFSTTAADDVVEFDGRGGDRAGTVVGTPTTTSITVRTPQDYAGVTEVTVHDTATNTTSATVDSASDEFTYVTVPVIAVRGTKTGQMYVSTNGGPFLDFGGHLNGAPSVVSSNATNFYFARGTDNNLYVRTDRTSFTALRSTPLNCATAPEAILLDGDGDTPDYAVACIGRNGHLYSASGVLPATGNPTFATDDFVESVSGGLNNDFTKIQGGVGSEAGGEFVVTGPAYAAGGAGTDGDQYVSGNTYLYGPEENPGAVRAHAPESEFQPIGGACGGAPSVAVTAAIGETGDPEPSSLTLLITCRRTTSAATVTLEESYTGVDGDPFEGEGDAAFSATTLNIGGVVVGSPTAVYDPSGDGVDIFATGTNGRLYLARAAANRTATGYAVLPIAADANSGPGVSAGTPPPAAAAAARAFASRH